LLPITTLILTQQIREKKSWTEPRSNPGSN